MKIPHSQLRYNDHSIFDKAMLTFLLEVLLLADLLYRLVSLISTMKIARD